MKQRRHGEFEPDKAQYSTPNFFDRLFLKGHIETQNLGKAQPTLVALPAVEALGTTELDSQKGSCPRILVVPLIH